MNKIIENISKYQDDLSFNTGARKFLKSRGFYYIDELQAEYGVGSCSWEDYYQGYIVLPISVSEEKTDELQDKFITSRTYKDCKPIHKHLPGPIDYFYNHETIKYNDNIIIVESPLCALSLSVEGIPAVATMGASTIPKYVTELDKNHSIIIIPDSDSHGVGLVAANKLAMCIQNLVGDVSIAELKRPEGKKKYDVNDLFTEDMSPTKEQFHEKIQEIITNAKEFVAPLTKTSQCNNTNRNGSWKNNYDILSVIKDHVFTEIESIGHLHRTICCFHQDTDPSLTIYPKTNSFYCWSTNCNAGGTVADFIMSYYDYSFKEAMEFLESNYEPT